MSYAQGTEHYEFPQFVGSDRPTFVDFNAAFRTIDTKLYGLEGDASTVDGRLDTIEAALPIMDAATQSAQNTADSAKAEADTNAEHITALEVLTSQHTTQIANKLDSVAIAEQYDPSAGTYSVGKIVVYNGQRYRCTTAVTVAEPFDADKWTGEDVETVLEAKANEAVQIAEATSNLTYAQQLTALQSVFSALNADRKRKCFIIDGDTLLFPSSRSGQFSVSNTTDTTVYISTYDIPNATNRRAQLSTSGNTFIDRTSAINTHELHLMCSL